MAKAKTTFDISDVLASGRSRYTFRAEADKAAVIDIFGEIDDWWGFGVREMAFNLAQHKDKDITINIHSPGGSVTEGFGIANLIAAHPGQTTAVGVGFVASIASIILLAADRSTMAKNAFLMIHNPWSISMGDSEELRKTADVLDKMENQIAGVYAAKMQANGNPVTLEDVKSLMAEETWYTADEAKAAGLIDEVVGAVDVADTPDTAKEQMEQLAKFSNIPQALADSLTTFNNAKTNDMAKEKSLFAKIGELFATAAEEINEAPETEQATEEPSDTTSATMTEDEMIELLKRNGYTVAKEEEAEEEETETVEKELVLALQQQVKELTAAVKRRVGTPSGGAESRNDNPIDGEKRPKAAMPFFDTLATVIKKHRPG